MTSLFKTYLRTISHINETDIERIVALATYRKLRRNEFLLEEGDVCKHKSFVVSGLLRTYGITPDGNEHILQFAPENSWTLDAESYNKCVPSRYNIRAVENTEVLMWSKEDFNELLATIPGLKSFSDDIISENMHATRNRLHTLLSAGPEEKYEDFLTNTPYLLQRLPLKMIAAYLGMSLKTLNRVRLAQLQRV